MTTTVSPAALEASYSYCESVARRAARNFYYSFLLLEAPERRSMCAVYAFMRYCDDLSDDPALAGTQSLDEWRGELAEALEGRYGAFPGWPALHDTVRRYSIPSRYMHEMIDGVSSDLEPRRVETVDELYRYCYLVASVVGLTIVHIFRYNTPEALPLAEKCGIAFQLTNILRDVREDAERGRIYLPLEDLRRFGVAEPTLLATRATPEFLEMMRFQAGRARRHYEESQPLIRMVAPANRGSLWALIEIYRRLLDRIEASNFAVLEGRVRLSTFEKMMVLVRARLGRGRFAD